MSTTSLPNGSTVLSCAVAACLLATMFMQESMAQTYESVVVGSNPLAYWRFEDASAADGSMAIDVTGNHTGTYRADPNENDPTLIIPPQGGSAVKFNGDGQHIVVPSSLNSLGSSIGQQLTFEFLFRSTSTQRGRIFGAFNNGNNTAIALTANTGATFQNGNPEPGMTSLYVRPQGVNNPLEGEFSNEQVDIYDGQWHHIVWRLDDISTKGLDDGTGNPADLTAYQLTIDGIEIDVSYGRVFTQERSFADFEHPFRIGAAGRADPLDFNADAWSALAGEVDEFAIYDRLLNSSEISDHFATWHANLLLPGDFNDDKVVNELDFIILSDNLAAHLDRQVTFEDGDFNFDGKIDLDDFALFKASYPHLVLSQGAVGVPEPATFAMAGLLIMLPLACRKRS